MVRRIVTATGPKTIIQKEETDRKLGIQPSVAPNTYTAPPQFDDLFSHSSRRLVGEGCFQKRMVVPEYELQ